MLVWLSVWSEVQIVCMWSSWCHCHPKTPSSLASFKSGLVLPFWQRLTQVVLEKRPLNGCSSDYTVSGSGICKSAPGSRQIAAPATHHSVFYRPNVLPVAPPTASKHWMDSQKSKDWHSLAVISHELPPVLWQAAGRVYSEMYWY